MASGVRFAHCKASGRAATINSPVAVPTTATSTHILSPIAFACRKSPRPSRLPTKMPPALPRPRDRHTSRSLTILAMELAATASAPKCPMITVYMVKPHPHTNSLPSTGRLYFQKSFCNGPSGCSTWPSRRWGPRRVATTDHASSIAREITVDIAAPKMPSAGMPRLPIP